MVHIVAEPAQPPVPRTLRQFRLLALFIHPILQESDVKGENRTMDLN